MLTSVENPIYQQVESRFLAFEKSLDGAETSTLHEIRKKALFQFKELGLPTTKNEEWKYTPISNQLKGKFDFAKQTKQTAISIEDIKKVHIPNLKANILVFINGIYAPFSSTILTPVHEMEILSLNKAAERRDINFDTYFSQIANSEKDAFTALNTAFADQGTFIYVPQGSIVELPTILHYISDSSISEVIAQPRNLFVLGQRAQATIIETYSSIGETSAFNNTVTEIVLHKEAILDYYKLQNENAATQHVDTTEIHQEGKSVLNAVTITVNGGMLRNNLNIAISEQYAESNLSGLYKIKGKTHIDNHTLVDHIAPNCQSNELYKGIVDESSTAVFNGKIYVKQAAQKTNAFQSNKNILLSDNATVNTKPQLEIFADDVKCSHGTTVGALDEEPMFYLRSRGLDEDSARLLLLKAFAGEVIDKIKIPEVRELVESWIA
jgi:Fe-S cluster assembly protein SufD